MREHWVWRVDAEADTILSEVAKIPELYLLDGHHRLKAAGQSYLNNEKKSKFSKIQGILYSKKYVNTFSQHRGLSNLPEDLNLIEHMTNNLGIEVRKLKEDGSK